MKNIVFIVLALFLFNCSSVKKSKRQIRKANTLLLKAKASSPELFDTAFITKKENIVFTKDSLITKIRFTVDSTKIDSLIKKLIKAKAENPKTIIKTIYEEILPDSIYNFKDSLKIEIDKTQYWIKFNIVVDIENGELTIISKPANNISITTQKAVINIDARKKGRFWNGFKWGVIIVLILVVLLWFIRDTIKKYI